MPYDGGTWTPYATANGTTDFTEAMQYANTATGDIFGIAVLASIFLIVFVGGSGRGNDDLSLAGAAFLTTILSILMAAFDVVGDWVAVAMIFITVAAVVILYRGGGGSSV